MVGALKGITVLDLSRVLAGPLCTMMLADVGAEVVKVERPGEGDETREWGPPWAGDESAYYLSLNRNKRGITVDLKTEEGGRSCAASPPKPTSWSGSLCSDRRRSPAGLSITR